MKALGVLAMAMTIGAAPPLSAQPETYPVRGDTGHDCDAAKAKSLVGRKRSPKVEAEALRLTGAGSVRWIPMGAMVTMDYRPDRLNLHLDRKGRIVRVNCG
jgi:peptidase inhibitor I78 family protein